MHSKIRQAGSVGSLSLLEASAKLLYGDLLHQFGAIGYWFIAESRFGRLDVEVVIYPELLRDKSCHRGFGASS